MFSLLAAFTFAGPFERYGVEPRSSEADAVLFVANHASFDELDHVIGLDRRGAQAIVEARPLRTLSELDRLPYVAETAFQKLEATAYERGLVFPVGD